MDTLNNHLKTSEVGVNLIKQAEGFSPRLYEDEGHPCIGYGCDLTDEEAAQYDGIAITADQADALLRSKLPPIEDALNGNVAVPLNQNQFDALADFIYNEGVKRFLTSTLLKDLNAGDYQSAALQLLRWDYAGGKLNAGLEARRKQEEQLFLSPI